MLVLALAGAEPEEIIADYELSPDPYRDELLAQNNTSVRDAILGTLEGLDVENYLLSSGSNEGDLSAVRQRLLG